MKGRKTTGTRRISRFLIRMALLSALLLPVTVKASSGSVQFTTASTNVQKGEVFTIVCTVTSPDPFLDTEFIVGYNPDLIQFIKGGSKVSGGGGELRVSSTGNTSATNKKTFSLQFAALKKGGGAVVTEGEIKVTDADGNAFSMSSNRLSFNVIKKQKEKPVATPAKPAVVTPAPVLSSNNRLRALSFSALSLKPAFSPDVKEYKAKVDCSTDTLFFSFAAEDEKTRVRIQGNENLKTGLNPVQVITTAEDGTEDKYNIQVTKETEKETGERQKKGADADVKDVTFSVTEKNGVIRLKNAYDFEVLDVSSQKDIPAGYIESSIELDGVTVPAFTMENDLDNNYLLLYLKGPSGENGIYQFDRTEKTLQRYTGSMTEKVNRGAQQTQNDGINITQKHILFGVITGLILVILCLLIAMLKMAIDKRKERS